MQRYCPSARAPVLVPITAGLLSVLKLAHGACSLSSPVYVLRNLAVPRGSTGRGEGSTGVLRLAHADWRGAGQDAEKRPRCCLGPPIIILLCKLQTGSGQEPALE